MVLVVVFYILFMFFEFCFEAHGYWLLSSIFYSYSLGVMCRLGGIVGSMCVNSLYKMTIHVGNAA